MRGQEPGYQEVEGGGGGCGGYKIQRDGSKV